jgi:hypothetical protein
MAGSAVDSIAGRRWPGALATSGPVVRSLPSVAAGLTALALLIALAFDSGGYFAPSYLLSGAVAFGVLAVAMVLRPPHYSLSTPALVGLASLIGLVIWSGLSANWSSAPDTALEVMQRNLAYLGLFGLGLMAAGSGRFARQLAWGVLGAVVVIVGAGLLTRLFPHLVGPSAPGVAGYRLQYPISYWNGFGCLAAVGAVLSAGLCADTRTRGVLRACGGAAGVICLTALYLSFSRGSWLALILGAATLLAMGPRRIWLLVNVATVAIPAGLAILALQHYPELVDRPAGIARQVSAGHAFTPQLVILVVAAAAAQFVLPLVRPGSEFEESLKRLTRPLMVVGVLALLVAAATVLEGPGDRFLNRQWQDFQQTSTPTEQGNARLFTTKGTRSGVYRVARREFRENPVAGGGAGSFEFYWQRHRTFSEDLKNAHSLYLETLAELGIVGFALLLGFLGSILAAAIRASRRPRGLRSAQVSAITAAIVVWAVHAVADWDWQLSAVTGTAIVLAAALYPEGRRTRRRSRRRRTHRPLLQT